MAKIYGFSIFVILTILIPGVAGMKSPFSRKKKEVEEERVIKEKPEYKMIDGTAYLIHRGRYAKIWNGFGEQPLEMMYQQDGQPIVTMGSQLTVQKCAQFCTNWQCTAASYNANTGKCTLFRDGLYTVEEGTLKDNGILYKNTFETHIYRVPKGVTYKEGLAAEVGN